MTSLAERFDGDDLDRSVWVPWYLPHWSSRESSKATYTVRNGELRLSIPPDQPLWAEGVHETPLRVSGIQSANFSGPVGSTIGGQPFLDGQNPSVELAAIGRRTVETEWELLHLMEE